MVNNPNNKSEGPDIMKLFEDDPELMALLEEAHADSQMMKEDSSPNTGVKQNNDISELFNERREDMNSVTPPEVPDNVEKSIFEKSESTESYTVNELSVKKETQQTPDSFSWDEEPHAEVKDDEPRSTLSKVMSIVLNTLFYLIIIGLVGGSTLFAFSNDPQKSYFGFRFYNVLTNSMNGDRPDGFAAGSVIVVKLTDPSEIQKDDIITFVPGSDARSYLTHRVVEVKTELNGMQGLYFVTRGDTNNADDPPISGKMVVGKKVFSIPFVGSALKFVRENFILTVVFMVATFGFILVLRYYFAKPKEAEKE